MAVRVPSTVALRLRARSLVSQWARSLSDSVTYDASNADVEALIEENIVSDTAAAAAAAAAAACIEPRRSQAIMPPWIATLLPYIKACACSCSHAACLPAVRAHNKCSLPLPGQDDVPAAGGRVAVPPADHAARGKPRGVSLACMHAVLHAVAAARRLLELPSSVSVHPAAPLLTHPCCMAEPLPSVFGCRRWRCTERSGASLHCLTGRTRMGGCGELMGRGC